MRLKWYHAIVLLAVGAMALAACDVEEERGSTPGAASDSTAAGTSTPPEGRRLSPHVPGPADARPAPRVGHHVVGHRRRALQRARHDQPGPAARAGPRRELGRERRRPDLHLPAAPQRRLPRRQARHRPRREVLLRAGAGPGHRLPHRRHVPGRHRRGQGAAVGGGAGGDGRAGHRRPHAHHQHRGAQGLLPGQAHVPHGLRRRPREHRGAWRAVDARAQPAPGRSGSRTTASARSWCWSATPTSTWSRPRWRRWSSSSAAAPPWPCTRTTRSTSPAWAWPTSSG